MFKKVCKVFSVVLFVAALTTAAQAADAVQKHEMKNGVSVEYPAGWQAMENAAEPTTALILANPSAPGFGVVITVTEGAPEGSMTMTEDQAKAAFSQMGSDFKMITFGKAKLAGQDATLMEYSFKLNDVPMQNRQIMGLVGTKGIIVTTSFADTSKLAELHKTAEAIESSIAVK